MEIDLNLLNDGKFDHIKKDFSHLNITHDNANKLSLSVKIVEVGENAPPHTGFVTFKNVDSKALRRAVKLVYDVIGMLYEDSLIRKQHCDVKAVVSDLDKEILVCDDEIKLNIDMLADLNTKYKCIDNLPDNSGLVIDKLNDLRAQFEEYKIYLNRIKKTWEETGDEQCRDRYIKYSQDFRDKIVALNSLVDIVNEKYIQRLNTKIDIDRHQLNLSELQIKKDMLIEKIKILASKTDVINDELIYITKRLDSEEDYEL